MAVFDTKDGVAVGVHASEPPTLNTHNVAVVKLSHNEAVALAAQLLAPCADPRYDFPCVLVLEMPHTVKGFRPYRPELL